MSFEHSIQEVVTLVTKPEDYPVVTTRITNTGDFPGYEFVQLFMGDRVGEFT